VTFEELRVKSANHRSARSGRYHDYLGVLQPFHNPDSDILRLFPAPRIKRRLSAANDRLVKVDLMAKLFENPDHADSDRWRQLIDKARNEKRDFHRKKAS
jgi:hypothetical protein